MCHTTILKVNLLTTTKKSDQPTAKLIWATPDGDNLVGYLARVSNPKAQSGDPSDRLIRYLIDHKHWSPFEMVNACVELNTTRDISHQIVRHRSFAFQEFSGRYAAYSDGIRTDREPRLQDTKNRQSSLPLEDEQLEEDWGYAVQSVSDNAYDAYQFFLNRGIAKEVARALLPEGLVPAKLYMNGSLRSWIHYWNVRCTPDTQKEHRIVAEASRQVVLAAFPGIAAALG